MKNLIIILLLFPIISYSQYGRGLKDCHLDFVMGYDYGTYNGTDRDASGSNIQSWRIGTNITYPINNRTFLVTGFRFASKSSTINYSFVETIDTFTLLTDLSVRGSNFYGEFPFSVRYLLKNLDWDNRLYIEGGMQYNFYLFSSQERKTQTNDGYSADEKYFGRDELINPFTLGLSGAIGWESELRDNLKLFVQVVGRYQLFSELRDLTSQPIHGGIELGIRF